MSSQGSSDSEAAPIPPPTDLAAYTARLQSAIIPPTRIAAKLPFGSDLAYQRTLDRNTAKELDAVSKRIKGLVNKLVTYAGGPDKGKARADDLLEGRDYRALVGDVLDQLLENADVCLDQFAGRNKAPAIDIKVPVKPSQPRRLPQALLHAANLPKPQLKFKTPPDNAPLTTPYVPPLHPNPAPYANVPPESLLRSHPPAPITSFEETPFTYVDTPEQLKAMVASLKNCTEIALDLEHNSLRTYKGLVCLIQLSSRTQDWVIDALALREELGILRGVLEDPSVVKVLHGAESDVVWLQRDFGLFLVGLFDTFHASRILGFPKHSLAALLARYTDFIPDKQYQLADWRIRPLPEEMLHYARADTHYLLHIYDHLRNALLEYSATNPPLLTSPSNDTPPPSAPPTPSPHPWAIVHVLARSANTAGKPYIPEVPDPAGLAKRWDLQLGGTRSRSSSPDGSASPAPSRPVEQRAAVFEAVFWWRDKVARQEDESPVYILANTALFQIAVSAPVTLPALYKSVPRLSAPARQHAESLVEVVLQGVARAKREAVEWDQRMEDEQKERDAEKERKKVNEKEVVQPQIQTAWASTPVEVVDLWSKLQRAASATKAARTSALFGPMTLTAPVSSQARATKSTLLGSSGTRLSTSAAKTANAFEELRERIHGSISDAPTIPVLPPRSSPHAEPEPEAEPEIMIIDEPTPQPPKPAPASTSSQPETDVVTVARPNTKSKKRKTNASGTNTPQETKKPRPEVEEFDYTNAQSILDIDQEVEGTSGNVRKREKRKVASVYGNFPAPPKAQSEQRTGNRTHTFKK
ncbi:exosome complex exonuclease RRP6 [Rhizoctonia solani AG-1 IB]|uniref:Exosome complex exonuclease RRP6 n=1 Tax=Thanatephorus cucumeris (strain AG1-IB / isolate 7/3/14) TaxID=1108050 RepID=A0A0B7G2G8_THACB|nr:exosome complex exonuclease RRP6 [Rhizoctonia solani AG-1 IB]